MSPAHDGDPVVPEVPVLELLELLELDDELDDDVPVEEVEELLLDELVLLLDEDVALLLDEDVALLLDELELLLLEAVAPDELDDDVPLVPVDAELELELDDVDVVPLADDEDPLAPLEPVAVAPESLVLDVSSDGSTVATQPPSTTVSIAMGTRMPSNPPAAREAASR